MRITNKMIAMNCMNNINNNKLSLNKLQQQYSTGKKISKPSEDPVVAVRALKLRSNYVELNQYLEKNIPSAKSWLDTTEGALSNVDALLTTMYEKLNQGASDTLSVTDRDSIISSLKEYKKQIYNEGNTQYVGRYVFSGYKTDTSLTFGEDTNHLEYTIQETFSGESIQKVSYIVNEYSANQYDPNNPQGVDLTNKPVATEVYRIRLSYDKLKQDPNQTKISFKVDGVTYEADVKAGDAEDRYVVKDGDQPHFIPETGELIFSKEQYETFSKAKKIEVEYDKTSFKEGDMRPEHYFNTSVIDTSKKPGDNGYQSIYTVEDQQIEYEINFGQKLTVNTQAKDVLTHELAREIEELEAIVNKVTELEAGIKDVDEKLKDGALTDEQREVLTKLKENLEIQHTLQSKIMSDRFGQGMTTVKNMQSKISAATSDLGARYTRLELTENRLETQQVELEELISSNEDADIVETIIKYSSQQNTYNASLTVASKAVKNTLLDYI